MSDLFPELHEEPVQDQSPDPISVPIGKDPAGKQLVCGDPGKRTFEALFGFPRPYEGSDALAVTDVTVLLEHGSIYVSVSGELTGDRTIIIFPCWPEAPGRPDFFFGMRGDVPNAHVHSILQAAQQRLRSARYKTLIRAALRDPERVIERAAVAQLHDVEADDDGFNRSVVKTWSDDAAWHEFFADKEQERNFHHALRGHIVMVEHGDLECHYSTQPVGDGTIGFFNYSSAHVQPLQSIQNRREMALDEPVYMISDVQEKDVIRGAIPKLKALLDTITKRKEPPELVIARGTCTTVVIGDDMRGAVAKFTEETGIPAVFLGHLEDGDVDPFQAVFELLKDSWTEVDPALGKGRINLVGYPLADPRSDLRQMVERLGLQVNTSIIPDVDLQEMRHYTAAEVSVFFDSALYDASYRRVLADAPVPEIRPSAPCAPAGCRRWLEAIAEATGRQEQVAQVWESAWCQHATDWEALRSQVEGYQLGFVVDAARLEGLLHPETLTGVPIVRALQEMGFGIEILCLGTDPADFAEAIAAFDETASRPTILRCYATPEELEASLRDSESVAFYSEYFFDKRLSRTGKAQFSVADFQLGLEGSLTTLRNLLRICRLPFYRVYGSYLGEAFPPVEAE